MTGNSSKINIRPEVGMYAAFARMPYKPWYAVAEFVDNSVQSFLANRAALRKTNGPGYKLRVKLDFGEELIVVKDNAAGIALEDFPRAFRPAAPPPNRSGLSEFGLGMKVAACWFAQSWRVTTSALNEPVKRTVTFDIPKIVGDGVESLVATEESESRKKHFTQIELWNLNQQPRTRTIGKIREHLKSMYRRFLENDEIEIQVGDDVLVYTPPTLLIAPHYSNGGRAITWRKAVDLKLTDKREITGWAGLLGTASTANAGFSVFRRNRLIQGSFGEAYRPKTVFGSPNGYVYQRLVGELDVSGFSVSYSKDGIDWKDEEDDILALLKEHLDSEPLPLLKQAKRYRPSEATPSTVYDDVVQDVTSVAVQALPPILEEQIDREPSADDPPKRLPQISSSYKAEKEMVFKHLDREWILILEFYAGDSQAPWIRYSRGQGVHRDRVQIRINSEHPFQRSYRTPAGHEVGAFARIAVALTLAEVTSRESGLDAAGQIRENFEELLRALVEDTETDFDDE